MEIKIIGTIVQYSVSSDNENNYRFKSFVEWPKVKVNGKVYDIPKQNCVCCEPPIKDQPTDGKKHTLQIRKLISPNTSEWKAIIDDDNFDINQLCLYYNNDKKNMEDNFINADVIIYKSKDYGLVYDYE